MFSLYLFALLVGGALLLYSLVGGSDHYADAGHDTDHGPGQWLSVRTVTYFLFVFGGVGAILTRTWPPATMPMVLAIAVAAGLGIGAAVSMTFRYLRGTDSGFRESDDSYVGLPARVVLPIGEGRPGKVQVHRSGRLIELLAQPYDGRTGTRAPSDWTDVIIVEMVRGVAIVAPVDDPAVRELASITQL